MPTSLPELNVADIASWGIASRGAELVVNPHYGVFVPGQCTVIDIENNQDGSCAGLGMTCDGEVIHFFTADKVMEWPKTFFADYKLIGHNIKYDVQMLRKWGFDVSPDQIVWDTQLAEYVKDSTKNRYGLKLLAKEKFNADYPDYKALAGTGKKAVSIGTLPVDLLANYCCCDVLFTHRLFKDQLASMTAEQETYMDTIELPAMRVILEMEERGVQIDSDYIRSLDARFSDELSSVINNIRDTYATEINLNSWQQIKQLLVDKAGLHVPDTSADTLEKHSNVPLVKAILRYRELSKLRGTYTKGMIDRLDKFGRLHARFNQTITKTGRLSSSDPNLQNIPVRTEEGAQIRKGFIAKEGHNWWVVDYSQIQPCLMGHFSQDPKMLEVFHSKKSIYSLVTGICHLEKLDLNAKDTKAIAKVLWLALAFNAGAYALSAQSGLSVAKCYEFINNMEKELPTFFYWKNKVIAQTEIDGYVTTLFGRKIPLLPEWAHLGPNYIIQGSESEIVKLAQHATRHLNPVIAVHDEIDFELPTDCGAAMKEQIENTMSNVVNLSVPLRVEVGVGPNWLEAKP